MSEAVIEECSKFLEAAGGHLGNGDFKLYIDDILTFASSANLKINENKVWELKKNNPELFAKYYGDIIGMGVMLMMIMMPVTPFASSRFFVMVNVEEPKAWPTTETISQFLHDCLSGLKIEQIELLFTKRTEEEIATFCDEKL